MRTWFMCRDSWGNVEWPDGGAYLDQPIRLIRAFGIIARENAYWDKETTKK